jgi:4-hydroxy-tetrahydrodipicolinate reductase
MVKCSYREQRLTDNAVIKVGVCGLGTIGRKASELLLDYRTGFELVGAATLEEADIGRPLGEVVGAAADSTPTVVGSIDELLTAGPDVVVHATGSFLDDVEPQVLALAEGGANVVSPCEELAFPFGRFPDSAKRIDDAARSAGVTVLGSGVNPGFIFDQLLLTAAGVCWDVGAVRGRRVVDVTGFGENIHLRLGIGYTPEEFEEGHRAGTIAGHVGFPESIEMVCERLGLVLDGPVEQVFEPMIAETPAPTRYGAVDAGRTEGFVQRAIGTVAGEPRVQLELILHLRPHEAGYTPSDSVELDGLHPVRLTLDPGMDAVLATSAELVNNLPGLLAAPPGLKSAKDLPPSAAWLGGLEAGALR